MSDIYLYVYDLTKGMAKQFSAMFLGKHLDGVWHTGIVAYGVEWYFGNDGIGSCPPKGTPLGEPDEIIHLGKIELNRNDFDEILAQFSQTRFRIGTYNLIEHNCNNFSNELAQILLNKSIPQHILDLPKEVLNSPIGPMLRPFLEQAADPLHLHRTGQLNQSAGLGLLNSFAQTSNSSSSNTNTNTQTKVKETEKEKIPTSVEQFEQKSLSNELQSLISHCESNAGLLSINEQNLLSELKDYLSEANAKWSINKKHFNFLIELYAHKLNKSNIEQRLAALKVLEQLSLGLDLAELLVQHDSFKAEFLMHAKSAQSPPDLKLVLLQLLSNICTHRKLCVHLLETNQEIICKDLVELILVEAEKKNSSDIETLIHEASISFFYNLIAAFHLESHLDGANALAIGVALLERLPKFQSNQKETTYRMLALLRSCLAKSSDMRDLAHSMNFSLNAYKQASASENMFKTSQEAGETKNNIIRVDLEKNDTYESIVNNIDELIHQSEYGQH